MQFGVEVNNRESGNDIHVRFLLGPGNEFRGIPESSTQRKLILNATPRLPRLYTQDLIVHHESHDTVAGSREKTGGSQIIELRSWPLFKIVVGWG